MKEKLRQLFAGRQGMDELSKLLFWAAIVLFTASAFLGAALGSLLSSFALLSLILSFARAFSRNLPRRKGRDASSIR